MTAHKDFFDPGTVDEQIDELLTMQETTEPMSEQRFAHDLQQILASNEEDKRSLQLVLNRLAESNVQQQHQPLTLLPKIPSQRMQQPLSGMLNLTKYTPRSPLLRALNILVAVMVVAALVGSIFILLRSISLYNAQISTQPQEMQSQHLGQVVYRSNGYDMARGPQWSPDGKRIAAAIDNQVVKSWDAMSGKNVITYPSGGKEGFIYGPSWSPDGKMLAVASSGKHIYLFDAKSATQLKILPVPSGQQTFISSSSSALTSPQGSTARIFMSALSGGANFSNVSWSPNGSSIAAGFNNGTNTSVYIWDVHKGALIQMLSDFSDNIVDVSWSPDGKRLGMLGYTHDTSNNRIQETLIIWNSTTWKEIEQRPDVTAFAWSPNGQQIALAVASTDYSQERDIRIVDAATGSTLKLIAEGSSIGKIAWSPDGTCLASENAVNSDIQLWNVANGQLRYSFTEAPAYQPSWSPDSRYIVSLRTFAPNPQFPIGKVEIIVWAAR